MFLSNEPSADRGDSGNDNSGSPHETLHIDCAPSNQSKSMVLIFIESGSRRVHIAGCPPNPSAPRVTWQASTDVGFRDARLLAAVKRKGV